MKKFNLALLLLGSLNIVAQEETEEKKVSISGSIDAYFQSYINTSDDLGQSFGTSFADRSGFALGMANVIASYDGKKTGVVADLAFGPRGIDAVGGDNDVFINQLYAYWNVSEVTTLTLGRFNTYLGYEVISPTGNFNYSTSYLFSSGPFSHLGLKADFDLGNDFSLMLAIMNATDVYDNMTGDYAFGAQLGFAGQFLNLYYDNDEVLGFEIDYTGGFDLSEDFFLGINGAYQTIEKTGFYGIALYPQLATSEDFNIGLRGEMFGVHAKDIDDLPNVLSLTLTGSYSLENLTIKPEIRLDSWSNDMPYLNADSNASENLAALTLAIIYSF